MVRSIAGFAGFFLLFVIGMKLIGFVFFGLLAIVMKILWLAFLGWVVFTIIKIVSPSTADRIRDAIRGRPKEA
jgi:hypothetical protein